MKLWQSARQVMARTLFNRPARPARRNRCPLRMEVLEDRTVPSTFSVINTSDSDLGSLRQAIIDSNAHGNFLNSDGAPDVIAFNIPADDPGHFYYRNDGLAGHLTLASINTTSAADDATIADIDPDWKHSWFTIVPASSMAAISDAVVLDGYSQSGASPNTNGPGLGDNAVLRIALDGTGLQFGRSGVTLTAVGSTVQGFAINHFNIGIYLTGTTATVNLIQGNFIGTDASGLLALPNANGVALDASNNTIGGTAPADRNVISGNINPGIQLGYLANLYVAHDNLIQGNFIGTDASGAVPLGNESDGIAIGGNKRNVIGGTTAAARNVISGNRLYGVVIGSGESLASDNVIEGNYIGTDVTGAIAVPNAFGGVFDQDSPNTTIGGAAAGAGNLISGNLGDGIAMNFQGAAGNVIQGNRIGTAADGISPLGNSGNGISVGTNIAILDNVIGFNGAAGVVCGGGFIDHGTGNDVLGNSIFSNVGRGITIGIGGFFPANDPGDADTGPNNLQNFPEISAAGLGSDGMLTITYNVPSDVPNATYPLVVEFFKADADGQEGQVLLGSDTFTTLDLKAGGKTVSFAPAHAIAVGDVLLATATDAANNTSEFSAPGVIVSGGSNPGIADLALIAGPVANTVAFGNPLTYFFAVTNFGRDAASDVTFTDTLPAGVTFVSATSSVGGMTRLGDVLTFTLGDLAAHGNATVVITVNATAIGTLTDSANVTAAQTDPDLSNNTAQLTSVVAPGILQFSAPTYQLNESGGSAVIAITRTAGSTGTVAVAFAAGGGTAVPGPRGSDYKKTTGTLVFNDGETTKTIAVPITNDNLVEGAETIQLRLYNPTGGATLGGRSTAVLTIVDDDPEIGFTVGKSAASRGSEKTTPARLTVTLAAPSKQPVTVDYAVVGGTATGGGIDYTLPAGRLVFGPGQTTAIITIPIVNDTTFEPDETIVVKLSNPVNAFLGAQTSATYVIVNDDAPPDPAGPDKAGAFPVDLATMPRQVLTNTLSKPDADTYKVHLDAGDFLAIDVDPSSIPPLTASTLSITAPNGTVQTIGDSREPDTGAITHNPAFGFRATATGDYYLLLTTRAKIASGYTLELHRLVLAEGRQDPAALQQIGPMYAFLNNNGDGTGTLFFTGPTGYGFGITGHWQQTTFHSTTLVTSTYAATGSLTLQTAFGAVPLEAPADQSFTVTTKPSTFGGIFGEVKSIQAQLLGSLDNFTGPFTARFEKAGAMIGLSAPTATWQIELGSQLRADHPNGQMLDGVPYLVSTPNATGHFQFGNESFDVTPPSKVGDRPFFAIDPTDAMLYLSIPKEDDFAFAASMHGRIPFEPLHAATISGADTLGKFFGHVFVTGTLEFKVYFVTVEVNGAVTVNLDANGDGQVLAGDGNASQLFHGDLAALPAVFHDIDVGVDGIINLGGWEGDLAKVLKVDVKLGDVSTVFNGQQGDLWVSGTAGGFNPLAGTPFKNFVMTNNDVFEAAFFGSGRYQIGFSTEQNIGGTELGFNVTLNNDGISTQISGGVKWVVNKFLSAQATLSGRLAVFVNFQTGDLHYVGQVEATGSVWYPGGSAGFDVWAEVADCVLLFDLPHIGLFRFAVPC